MDIDIGNPDELRNALARFYKHLENEGPSPEVYLDIANCHAFLGEHAKACSILRKAIGVWPENQHLRTILGRIAADIPEALEEGGERGKCVGIDELVRFVKSADYAEARLLLEDYPQLLSLEVERTLGRAAALVAKDITKETWDDRVELLFYCRKFGTSKAFMYKLKIPEPKVLDELVDLWEEFGKCHSPQDAMILLDDNAELQTDASYFAVAELMINSREIGEMDSYNCFKQRLQLLREYKNSGTHGL